MRMVVVARDIFRKCGWLQTATTIHGEDLFFSNSFFRQRKQFVTRSSSGWTPPLFSVVRTRTRCVDAAYATHLCSRTLPPSQVMDTPLISSKWALNVISRTFRAISGLLVTILDEKAEKRLRRKSAVPILVPMHGPRLRARQPTPPISSHATSFYVKWSSVGCKAVEQSKVGFGSRPHGTSSAHKYHEIR